MSSKVTKAQLVAENEQLAAQLREALDALHQLRGELLAGKLQVAQQLRPQRIVVMNGKRYAKVPSTVGGRTVFTYKELSQ